MFCIPFAYLPARARLASMDPALKLAAADLYARPLAAFAHITLPLLAPGLISGWLLAIIVSLDDFIISPMLRLGITPEINAISALMILVSTVVVAA